MAKTTGSKLKINTLAKCVGELRKFDAEMPAQQMALFLEVAIQPGITMKDLSDRLGLAQSSTSRSVAALSKVHRLGRAGLDLIEAAEDPIERRRKVVNLTPKGQKVVASMLDYFELMEK